jgi:hypothetical protein
MCIPTRVSFGIHKKKHSKQSDKKKQEGFRLILHQTAQSLGYILLQLSFEKE